MITINNNKYELTLVAITSKDSVKNPFIICKDLATTLITSDKKIYMYFKSEKINFQTLKNALINFFSNNQYDLNINLDSFPIDKKLGLEATLDAILYTNAERITYKTCKMDKKPKYNIDTKFDKAKELLNKFSIIYQYKNFARDLQDMPPNKMYPEKFADSVEAEAKKIPSIKITILKQADIVKNKMGMLLSVNAGSARDARVVILEYNGNSASKEKIALVGKGITFDTGGVSLKPSFAMEGMKYDMSGAAIACSSVMAIASLKQKCNLIAVACLTENHIGSTATLVESIVTSMNGKTVEITNTDAEGRLVVGDGVTYAIRKLSATKIIELSTLTGAILIALDNYMTGVFSNNDEFYKQFKLAALEANEEIWRMPIHEKNTKLLKEATIADLKNSPVYRNGGSSIAAAFIQEFVEDKPFIHLDIAGTATETRKISSGTGVMVRTFVELFK